MYSMDVNTMGSQVCIASCDSVDKLGLKMTNLESKHVAL